MYEIGGTRIGWGGNECQEILCSKHLPLSSWATLGNHMIKYHIHITSTYILATTYVHVKIPRDDEIARNMMYMCIPAYASYIIFKHQMIVSVAVQSGADFQHMIWSFIFGRPLEFGFGHIGIGFGFLDMAVSSHFGCWMRG